MNIIIHPIVIGINIFLNYILIDDYGIEGAVIATMVSFFISAALYLHFSNKYYTVGYNLKKLFIYIVNFLMIVILYKSYITNDMNVYHYIMKFILLSSWIFILIAFEKNLLSKLRTFRNRSIINR